MSAAVRIEKTEGNASLRLAPGSTYFGTGEQPRVPLTMPSHQEYYWHYEWQRGEREALSELRKGEGVRFDSDDPEDAARWLDADDD